MATSAVPRYHCPRSVPFAMRPVFVEEELDQLEKLRVLEMIDHADWAALILVVPKKDGHVRICRDYIKWELDVIQYPLPCLEDHFATWR